MSTSPTTPVTCPVCAVQAEAGTEFCGWCGAPIVVAAPPPAPAPAPALAPPPPPSPVSPAPVSPAPVSPAPVTAAPPSPSAGAPRPAPAPHTSRNAPSRSVTAVVPGEVAPVSRRLLAYVVDGAVIGVVYGLGTVVALLTIRSGEPSPLAFLPVVLAVLVGVGQWVSESVTGATVGGALLGIRTVSVRTGLPAGLLAVLLRNLVVAAGTLACGVGQVVVVLSGLWDHEPAQRGWHDKAAGTLVLRASAVRRRPASGADAGAQWESAIKRAVEPGAPAAHRPMPVVKGAPVPPDNGPALAPHPATADPAAPLITDIPGLPAGGTGAVHGSGPFVPPAPAAEPTAAPPVPARPEAPIDTAAVPLVELPPRRDRPAAAAIVDVAPWAATPPQDRTVAQPEPAAPATLAAPATPAAPAARSTPVAPATPTVPATPGTPVVSAAPAVPGTPVVPAPPVAPAASAAAPTAGLGDLEHTRLRESGPVQASATLRLVIDTGERVDVSGDGLLGRSPAPEDGVTHVVAVADRSVSKVHLAFGIDDSGAGRLWVADRGSTNGTFLVAPDGAGTTLTAGTRGVVEAGWTIRFGERSARVERA